MLDLHRVARLEVVRRGGGEREDGRSVLHGAAQHVEVKRINDVQQRICLIDARRVAGGGVADLEMRAQVRAFVHLIHGELAARQILHSGEIS
eukprot:3446179-Pleurochrysis_carterae.AAC.1